jgi:hypothetical protein
MSSAASDIPAIAGRKNEDFCRCVQKAMCGITELTLKGASENV